MSAYQCQYLACGLTFDDYEQWRVHNHADWRTFARQGFIEARPYAEGERLSERVSVSASDREGGSPKVGDMIARNPRNPEDQWLIAADFFVVNYKDWREKRAEDKR